MSSSNNRVFAALCAREVTPTAHVSGKYDVSKDLWISDGRSPIAGPTVRETGTYTQVGTGTPPYTDDYGYPDRDFDADSED